jgi:hypothetical protein
MTTETLNNPTLNGTALGGLGTEYDPQWLLSPKQLLLQVKLIDLCEKVLRPNAITSDRPLWLP